MSWLEIETDFHLISSSFIAMTICLCCLLLNIKIGTESSSLSQLFGESWPGPVHKTETEKEQWTYSSSARLNGSVGVLCLTYLIFIWPSN